MGYLFLTGATGLLGSYLVRDLLRAGVELAVLVRSTRLESARQRIDSLVARWERQAGHALPRPVVVEGDLTRPGLGLDAEWTRWAADHCRAVLHNAASLTFHAETPDGEPWRSNLHGTRHVLEFCREAGLREFHHVSTAYVCGLREGRVLESELDVGQRHGNDYEVSKFQAEQLVRGAEFLDSVTVYRPGIILGDSHSGYTTTFHGFYVPLKLVSTLINKVAGLAAAPEMLAAAVSAASGRLREILELDGQERKNFVPVDWCSAVMTAILTSPAAHGRTYHLTPRERTSVRLVQDVMEEAFQRYARQTSGASDTSINWPEFEKMFLEGMQVYRSYWKNDPEFDTANTAEAAPHLPCPDIDAALIMRMCRFAIESNFGWPRPPVTKPDFDVHEHLRELSAAAADRNGPPVVLGLKVNGRGGGQWELEYSSGRVRAVCPGLSRRATATFYLNSTTFERLARRQSTVQQAIGTGRVVIEGNGVPADELAGALGAIACGVPASGSGIQGDVIQEEHGAPPGPPGV